MKIVVIGASRGIGLEVVKQALERGHEVTALLRDPAKLELDHARLHKIRGDVGSAADVQRAIAGQTPSALASELIRPVSRWSCFLAARVTCWRRSETRRG